MKSGPGGGWTAEDSPAPGEVCPEAEDAFRSLKNQPTPSGGKEGAFKGCQRWRQPLNAETAGQARTPASLRSGFAPATPPPPPLVTLETQNGFIGPPGWVLESPEASEERKPDSAAGAEQPGPFCCSPGDKHQRINRRIKATSRGWVRLPSRGSGQTDVAASRRAGISCLDGRPGGNTSGLFPLRDAALA